MRILVCELHIGGYLGGNLETATLLTSFVELAAGRGSNSVMQT